MHYYEINPMNRNSADSKSAKFEKLAERRVSQVLKQLRLVGNLANKHNYVYTEEHVKQILDVLDAEMRQLKTKFRQDTSTQTEAFSFRK
jgi:hypothetical protein